MACSRANVNALEHREDVLVIHYGVRDHSGSLEARVERARETERQIQTESDRQVGRELVGVRAQSAFQQTFCAHPSVGVLNLLCGNMYEDEHLCASVDPNDGRRTYGC